MLLYFSAKSDLAFDLLATTSNESIQETRTTMRICFFRLSASNPKETQSKLKNKATNRKIKHILDKVQISKKKERKKFMK